MAKLIITNAHTHTGVKAHADGNPRRVPGWLWFIALWCVGVGSAVSVGYAFKLLMNATLFAVSR
ncbi:hypothetical protein GCM10027093_23750 [Paraburkholderia jirisanensis]